MKTERIFLPTPNPPGSLCWSGDALIDWVSGGLVHHLDGRTDDPHVRYAYRFDRAVMSPDGRFAILYEVLGTKAIVLKEGELLREIHRSFYHADAYEYPIALHTLPSGRTLLAHCPDDYCRLEIEDVETGERLTRRESESPDIFHSRLQFSADGRYLLSAGWVWHPLDMVFVFDVSRALDEPATLDSTGGIDIGEWGTEIYSAAFAPADRLILLSPDRLSGGEGDGGLSVYSLTERRFLSEVPLEAPMGTMMAVGEHVLGLYEHPKLVELATGKVIESWPELDTGRQGSSIIRHLKHLPPLALDPVGQRFAVGTEKGIEILRFTP